MTETMNTYAFLEIVEAVKEKDSTYIPDLFGIVVILNECGYTIKKVETK